MAGGLFCRAVLAGRPGHHSHHIPDFGNGRALGCVGLRSKSRRRTRRRHASSMSAGDPTVVIDFIVGADAQVCGGAGAMTRSSRHGIRPLFDDHRARLMSEDARCRCWSKTSPACWRGWRRYFSESGFQHRVVGGCHRVQGQSRMTIVSAPPRHSARADRKQLNKLMLTSSRSSEQRALGVTGIGAHQGPSRRRQPQPEVVIESGEDLFRAND